jgi:hypothetical protein
MNDNLAFHRVGANATRKALKVSPAPLGRILILPPRPERGIYAASRLERKERWKNPCPSDLRALKRHKCLVITQKLIREIR